MSNKIHNQINLRMSGKALSDDPFTAGKIRSSFCLACGVVLLAMGAASSASAANVSLNASDAYGTSSFAAAGNWSSGAAPAAGNDYFTGAHWLRTPANTTPYIFGGNSLSVDSGGRLLLKTTGTTQVLVINRLILNGGHFEQATASNDNYINTVAGSIQVSADSGIGALGGTSTPSSAFETLNIAATITGSAALQLGGSTLNAGADSGVVKLSAANPYSGTLTVSGGTIASSINRLLQLNNRNALSNATLNLDSTVANPVSFAAGVNSGPFQLGQLAGTADQSLADTAGTAVTLSVGGNNASSAYSGTLTGAGALIKTGAGTLTLSGVNTYTGGTTILGGALQTTRLWGIYSGAGKLVLMAPSAATAQSVSTAAFTGQWVVAGGWLAAADGTLGTNCITVDPHYPLGTAAAGVPVASTTLFEPQYDLNSAGSLILTNGGRMLLHQNCAFTEVTIEGVALTNGIYSAQDLVARFPDNFAATAGGYIAVQPYGPMPTFPPQAPQFLEQPASRTTFAGMDAAFNASVYGNPPPTYQWQFAASGSSVYTKLTAGGQFSGVTNNSLTIANLTAANAGSYVLVASNSSGSVTSSPALLTVNGPAVITNTSGLSVSMAANGVYTINSTAPAWSFTGNLGMTPVNVSKDAGTDGVGGYTEFQFNYTASVPHQAGIRLYTNQPVVLFTDTGLADSPNDLAFPHLTSYPANLYHESFSTAVFAPRTFSQLVDESPWVFFNTNFDCFILSPATNYMIAGDVKNGDGSISCGIKSAIGQLPAGFTHRTILAIQNGIHQTFNTWGKALTGLSGKVRPANDATVELDKLGYWTDNGADYYYNYNSSLGYEGTMLAVRDEFAAKGFPLGYLQLDSWWYPKGVANTWEGDSFNSRGGINLFQADSTLFPDGLASFQQQLGLPLITHARWIDPVSPYRSQYAMSANVIVDPAYWTNRMAYLKAGGVVTYEQDWLDNRALPALNLHDPPAFMNDMASAAAGYGINMQYCMALPRHFLQSTLYNNLVTMRVSNDRFEIGKWNEFLYTSQLAEAVGCWPWVDVYFSRESRNLLLSTLSAGPVGVGDALGDINTANLAQSVRPDGVIVKPDVPLTPINQTYVNDAKGLNTPMVAATYVDHGASRAAYVFAYARSSSSPNTSFIPSQLGIPGSAYVYDFFNHTGSIVAAGNAYSFSTTVGGNNSGGSYFVVVPVGPSGIALLGDTNKFVTLGKKRIPSLKDAGVIKVSVSFAAAETNLTLTGYAPSAPYIGALEGSFGAMRYDPATHLFSINLAPDSSHTATLALSLSPLPYLQITNVAGNMQICWPTSAIGYHLESTTTLQAPASWSSVTNSVSVVGDLNSVGVTPVAPYAFYRLKQ